MSYILSALRKAEEERRQGQVSVSERMLSSGHESKKSRLTRPLMVVLAVTMMALAALVTYRLLMPEHATLHDDDRRQQVSFVAPTSTVAEEKITPLSDHQIESTTASAGEKVSEPLVNKTPEDHSALVLPEINITGYIYFESNPDNSKLFVDGVVYRLHSQVVSGLTIESFHEGYVDVMYKGRPAKLPLP